MNQFYSTILIVFLLMQGCNTPKKSDQTKKQVVEKIQVTKIDFLGSVMTKVECENFSQLVGKGDAVVVIEDGDRIQRIMSSLSNSPSIAVEGTPDTKAVLEIFFFDGHMGRLCVGNFHAIYDGQSIQLDDSLRNFLIEL